MKKLIISADDFGYRLLYNKMILELIEGGCITSTSVIVELIDNKQNQQIKQLKELAEQKLLSIGLHIYFTSTMFKEEIERQYRKFDKIFSKLPDFIDLHKSTYLSDGYPVIQRFAREKNIPCRNLNGFIEGIMYEDVLTTRYPVFEGSRKSFDQIKEWIEELHEGVSEIVFHPGYSDPENKTSIDRAQDAKHIKMLQSLVKEMGVTLISYNDI